MNSGPLHKARRWLRGEMAGGADHAPDISSRAPWERLADIGARFTPEMRVLDVGTRQVVAGRSTHSMSVFPKVPRRNYLLLDVEEGADVDVVGDLHRLPEEWTGRFDAVVAIAVFEHLARPWIAAHEVARVLAPGGICFVSTHQTYPLHGYPSDYFRFSKEALSLIFDDAGMIVLEAAYEHRAEILAPEPLVPKAALKEWNKVWPSYCVVNLLARKPA